MPDQKPANMTPVTTLVSTDRVYFQSSDGNTDKAITKDNLDTALRGVTGVEAGATADQTGAEIKTLYEGEADTNAYTDAEKTKLASVESAADVTDATNVAAAGAVMDSDLSEAEGFMRKTGAGAYEAIKTNLGATTDPGTGNDNTQGYAVGSRWINVTLDKEFVALDVSTGAAVWKETTGAGGGGAGDVVGPGSATDNALARFDTATGKLLQNSNATLDDAGLLDVPSIQPRAVVRNDETVNFQFVLADAGKVTTANSATDITGTVPDDATLNFPIDTILPLHVINAGNVTWTPLNGNVTLLPQVGSTLVTAGNPSWSWARKIAANTWHILGDLLPTDEARSAWHPFPLSDEVNALITGVNVYELWLPNGFVCIDAAGAVTTGPTGASILVDVKDDSVSIFTNRIEIEAGDKNTSQAVTPPSLATNPHTFAAGSLMTFDIDQVGSTIAGAGLKAWLKGYFL
ncbi:MAG: hypothetical protein MJE12_25435 [Alphaproteobacteria bacterium]|nr:hypothetical protein [Alphaproteobacteria bacterium]